MEVRTAAHSDKSREARMAVSVCVCVCQCHILNTAILWYPVTICCLASYPRNMFHSWLDPQGTAQHNLRVMNTATTTILCAYSIVSRSWCMWDSSVNPIHPIETA